MKKETKSLNFSTAFARPFSKRGEMTPLEFSNELTDIREAVIAKVMSVAEAKVALLSLQIQLNHCALEMEYMKIDHAKELMWRMPVLDRSSQPELTNGNTE